MFIKGMFFFLSFMRQRNNWYFRSVLLYVFNYFVFKFVKVLWFKERSDFKIYNYYLKNRSIYKYVVSEIDKEYI